VYAPLLDSADFARPLLWTHERALSAGEFVSAVARLAQQLPDARYLINLCEHRHEFLIAYCAALLRAQTNLLPSTRAPEVVTELVAAHAASYLCDDEMVRRALLAPAHAPLQVSLVVSAEHVAEIAFTSGSTGRPQAHRKRWGNLLATTALNAERVRACLAPRYGNARPWIIATVPPQHMYGTETSVLLPLAADMAVHTGRPLFPADVAAALAQTPEPRVLVTTPVHLRALVASNVSFPPIGVVVSATAPLEGQLAARVEAQLDTTLLEMFGSTETCVIATRLTASEEAWHLYPGVRVSPQADCARVEAPWFDAPTELQDVVELLPGERMLLKGRNVDMIEVAGKRASLSDLTRRLLAVPGVLDGIVFQPDAPAGGGSQGVRRVAALAVAPGLAPEQVAERLSQSIDPAFVPRPLVLVSQLPRNELGKLERERLLAALHSAP
jgi:acyl-coenzyme A synthetase/AMP-(fatty) acid ligase